MRQPPTLPRATYRVQLHQDFRFDDAAALAGYLADLGFSHLYASPIMAAKPGSMHGYDIVDHNRFNPELGGEEGFERLIAALDEHGLGLILDIVPNHVGIGVDNAAWMDVLEWGQRSPHALDFDIDWKSSRRNLEGKVLLPVLGDQFGLVLERGEIALKFDARTGSISAWYYENRLPISAMDYAELLEPALLTAVGEGRHRLANLVRDFQLLKEQPGSDTAVRETAASLKQQLAETLADESGLGDLIQQALASVGGHEGDRQSWDRLGLLLDRQSYRAAYWRVSSDEVNYRRFFDINELAGLRVERRELFDEVHRTTLRLVAENKVQGLRIDHIDGLFDPRQYSERLSERLARCLQDAAGKLDAPAYILLEKILAHYEELPGDWPVAGTTGYDTLNLLGGLFVDPDSERALSTIYRRYSGERKPYDEILYECKKLIVQNNLASEMGVLANAVQTLSASQWRSRDFTYAAIRKGLEELVARFPVYRTYLDESGRLSAADRRYIEWAVGLAKKNAGPIETSIFDFIGSILSGDLAAEGSPYSGQAVRLAAMRFQQLSGPAMAKGLEDTSFYRYFRLLVHNEVGGDPRRYAVSPSAFHKANAQRLQQHPLDMIGGSTHDTKRGEDARARIACLSGLSTEWAARLRFWSRSNRRLAGEVDGEPAPDFNHQYYFYQTLIGAWPADLAIDDAAGLASLAERVEGAMLKAAREGKQRSSWTQPNEAYEQALARFVKGALMPGAGNPFLADFQRFAARVAWFGALTSLSQTLLRLTMPGVPDIYRGSELWELSMVDPDNRRPVDYADVRAKSASLARLSGAGAASELLAHWQDGRVKLHLIRSVLRLRRERPGLFASGSYEAITATGARAELLLAFRRQGEDAALIVLAPRLWPQLAGETQTAASAAAGWADTSITLAAGRYCDVLSGRGLELPSDQSLPLARLLADFPVGLLLKA
ncbi:MAG: treY [Hydrocarboniphaga sp.]|uniref:malto-oligosyltrehalose synthase n=1 Tax=Hydrocarboniphaga sp. TaxID=2033016 RepID=UPI0026103EA4|nr:malto-oligosyltrehalose synthase [Hydrocarboniphaga sp.]MDB5970698.1 treY [Hydrocarboniphaga sp.]